LVMHIRHGVHQDLYARITASLGGSTDRNAKAHFSARPLVSSAGISTVMHLGSALTMARPTPSRLVGGARVAMWARAAGRADAPRPGFWPETPSRVRGLGRAAIGCHTEAFARGVGAPSRCPRHHDQDGNTDIFHLAATLGR
jgi:hypothetical protein